MSTTVAPPTDAAAAPPWTLYSGRERWSFLAVLFLVSVSNYADRNIIAVLLEPIKAEFGVSDTLLGLLSGASFALFYATLGIPIARLADRGDRPLIITASLTVWSLMTVVCGLAQNFWQLAAARVGVGAGEAGAIPPAQSLIADYYPPEKRAGALAIFMASATAGYLLAFVVGSQVAAAYDWRWAFIVVGAPGLLLAILTHTVLKEPRKRLPALATGGSETLRQTLRRLSAKRSYVHLLIGLVAYFLVAYGAIVFVPSYLVRVAGLPLTTVSAALGGVGALGAVLGTLGGGFIANRAVRRDLRWAAWLPAVVLVIAYPFYVAAFLTTDLTLFTLLSLVAGLCLSAGVPGIFTALHAVCGSARRAMAVAIAFFFANLVGLGLGPVITGVLSDAFSASMGAVGLRWALICAMSFMLVAALFFYLAGRAMPPDVES